MLYVTSCMCAISKPGYEQQKGLVLVVHVPYVLQIHMIKYIYKDQTFMHTKQRDIYSRHATGHRNDQLTLKLSGSSVGRIVYDERLRKSG